MEKKLALAFEFKNAPNEFKEIAEAHRKNYLRLEKAKVQSAKWISEKDEAQRAFNETSRRFDAGLDAWEKSLTAGPPEEFPETPAETPVLEVK